ncbi:anti-sigma factor [uncultured Roseibium sp.]|uniref:anti-sigma factor family protein n=1 Tax=uncultured Roseibium sp. TaxID=1936171 RepID=UPI0032172324
MTMTEKSSYIPSRDDLHAYADGLLPDERIAEMETYLAANPEARETVEDYRLINSVLKQTYDPAFEEPIPPAQIALARGRRTQFVVPMAAAVAGMILGAGLTVGVLGMQTGGDDSRERLAFGSTAAYDVYAPEKLHPVEVRADQSAHLSTWLTNRLGMPITIPSLKDLGFAFIGGRLIVADDSPAALLMYENAQGRRVVLYVRNDGGGKGAPAMRYERRADTGVVTWSDGNAGFGLAGGFTEKELMPAAQLVRAQFDI